MTSENILDLLRETRITVNETTSRLPFMSLWTKLPVMNVGALIEYQYIPQKFESVDEAYTCILKDFVNIREIRSITIETQISHNRDHLFQYVTILKESSTRSYSVISWGTVDTIYAMLSSLYQFELIVPEQRKRFEGVIPSAFLQA